MSGLSGATGSDIFYTMDVPAGATSLSFNINGGSGDADLYIRFGSAPTTSTWDCRPYIGGNNESCPVATAQAGTYHVMIRAYQTYSGVTLTGSYTGGGTPTPTPNPTPTPPTGGTLEAQNFESGLGNWINVTSGDSHDWTRDSGGTTSAGTGPSTGANGSTWYMYLETSNGSGAFAAGNTAILEGPSIGGSGRTLRFDYHMYGADMGTLSVDVQSGGAWINNVWTINGQQHSSNAAAYSQAIVDLSTYSGTLKVRIRATAAGNYRGDMAIDNIEITGQ